MKRVSASQLAHAMVANELEGLLDLARDKTVTRKMIQEDLEEALRQVTMCREKECSALVNARKRARRKS